MKTNGFFILAIFLCIAGKGQQNFTHQPSHPRPGDVITITYTPAGDLTNTSQPVEAVYYLYSRSGTKADDLILKAEGSTYSGTIATDTSVNFVQLGFFVENTWDNNFNRGYSIPLWEGDSVCKESYMSLALFYLYHGERTGVEENEEKALAALETQRSLYPDLNRSDEWVYYSLLRSMDKNRLRTVVLSEIEAAMKKGLRTENEYTRVKELYEVSKLMNQAAFIDTLIRIKFPLGAWSVMDSIEQFYSVTDKDSALTLALSILGKIKTDPRWKDFGTSKSDFQSQVLQGYAGSKQWDQLKKFEKTIDNMDAVASTYNELAWEMQGKKEDLEMAEEISEWATKVAKKEITQPSVPKPSSLTQKQWKKERERVYAMYADTYAMVEFRLGKDKEGFPFAEESAITINKGQDADLNNTWALLAEKVLPPEKCLVQLEKFVREGRATDSVKAVLKRVYIASNKPVAGYGEYLRSLENEAKDRIEAETRKRMINLEAPLFTLKNLEGEEVDLAKLRGKVVVIDFWATWCGPCKASMPGMQKEVNKFKDNPDVQFLFIDSWEQGEPAEKLKNASGFMSKYNYDFNVLLDNDNSVIKKYKVSGVPTKFIVDKNGMIRFKTEGFGMEDAMIHELDAMIGICLKL